MTKKGYALEQIINKFREAGILLNRGVTAAVVTGRIRVSQYTCYRWRKEYGGMRGYLIVIFSPFVGIRTKVK